MKRAHCAICGTTEDAHADAGRLDAVRFAPRNAPKRPVVVCLSCATDASQAFAICERAELTDEQRAAVRPAWPGAIITAALPVRAKVRDGIRVKPPAPPAPAGGAA